MKTTNQFLRVTIILLLLFSSSIAFAQDANQTRPEYVVVTKMHWNMDNEDFSMDEWLATEKEYLDKVIKKNEYIRASGYYTHRYTEDNTELLFVRVFNNWGDIDKATTRNNELIKKAWPNKADADKYFKKQASYYDNKHSDEIYATMDGAKPVGAAMDDDMILYVRESHFAYPEDGSMAEFNEVRMDFTKNVLHKNEMIKGYYPMVHAWGADNTKFTEVFYASSMDDVDNMGTRTGELFQSHYKDEKARKATGQKWSKYFNGKHSDYVYTVVSELRK